MFEKIGSDLPLGLVQLAGGTNDKNHEFLKSNNLPDGIAFGSAARKLCSHLLNLLTKITKDFMYILKKWL